MTEQGTDYDSRWSPSILIHPGRGCMTVRPYPTLGRPPGSGGKRKSITGWSAASRRRLRRVLLSHYPPDGWAVYGMGFTIPGPVPTYAEAREMWRRWRKEADRAGAGVIWRMEVQKRGAMHWHAVVIAEHPDTAVSLQGAWHAINGYRMEVPGAYENSCDLRTDEWMRGRAWRYLCDHTSKRKQYQVATGEGVGRAWGVVGRDRWHVWKGVPVGMTERAFWRFLRAIRRLRRPVVADRGKCPVCPVLSALRGRAMTWGTHVRRSSRGKRKADQGGKRRRMVIAAGAVGRRVWFQEGDACGALLQWALESTAGMEDRPRQSEPIRAAQRAEGAGGLPPVAEPENGVEGNSPGDVTATTRRTAATSSRPRRVARRVGGSARPLNT